MKDVSKKGYPPATGLLKLTQAQVQRIDEVVDLMCRLSIEQGCEVEIVIRVMNGLPRKVKYVGITEELKPV